LIRIKKEGEKAGKVKVEAEVESGEEGWGKRSVLCSVFGVLTGQGMRKSGNWLFSALFGQESCRNPGNGFVEKQNILLCVFIIILD